MQVVIYVNADEVAQALNAFSQRAMSDLSKTMGALVEGQTKRRINVEKTAPDGAPWPPLMASTVRKKGNANILIGKGGGGSGLLGSISYTASASEAIIGTNKEYAPFLQEGTSRMPARTFLGISDENMVEIRKAVDAWVDANF